MKSRPSKVFTLHLRFAVRVGAVAVVLILCRRLFLRPNRVKSVVVALWLVGRSRSSAGDTCVGLFLSILFLFLFRCFAHWSPRRVRCVQPFHGGSSSSSSCLWRGYGYRTTQSKQSLEGRRRFLDVVGLFCGGCFGHRRRRILHCGVHVHFRFFSDLRSIFPPDLLAGKKEVWLRFAILEFVRRCHNFPKRGSTATRLQLLQSYRYGTTLQNFRTLPNPPANELEFR